MSDPSSYPASSCTSDATVKTYELQHGAETVLALSAHLIGLKSRAKELIRNFYASQRGYFTPTEDEQTRQLLVSYWQSRNALFELVANLHQTEQYPEEDRPTALTLAYGGALVLVDVARFLRNYCHDRPVVRAKLNEPEPHFGIPPDTYERVQRSLTRPVHAWHLYHAMTWVTRNWKALRTKGREDSNFDSVLDLIHSLQEQLSVSPERFVVARTRANARKMQRRFGRDLFGRALYGLQKCVSAFMADKFMKLGHHPSLPENIESELKASLLPGDVIVVRKEHAFTNYFLPGYWPHAAMYIGSPEELLEAGLQTHTNVKPRWDLVESAADHRSGRVLEAMKDGVRVRSVSNPFRSDAVAVIRPVIEQNQIHEAISRGFFHVGKSYDFDFDFSRSDRLVCTEVVYRSFEGVGGVSFQLTRRAGRMTLSAEDLLQKAVDGSHFGVHAVYCPAKSDKIVHQADAANILKQTIGHKNV